MAKCNDAEDKSWDEGLDEGGEWSYIVGKALLSSPLHHYHTYNKPWRQLVQLQIYTNNNPTNCVFGMNRCKMELYIWYDECDESWS